MDRNASTVTLPPSANDRLAASYLMQVHLPALMATLALGLLACDSTSDSTKSFATDGPVLPDTATIDGVFTMHHDSTAFARAPRLHLSAEPLVVYSDGGDPEFDLSTSTALLLPDGELIAPTRLGQGRMTLFGADGLPERVLATPGVGPGELGAPIVVVGVCGDTVLVFEGSTQRVSWFSAQQGFIRTEPTPPNWRTYCDPPHGVLSDGRLITVGRCGSSIRNVDGTNRNTVPLAAYSMADRRLDTLAMIPSWQMEEFETNFGGRRTMSPTFVRLGRRPAVVSSEGAIITGASERGYVIQRRRPDGSVKSEIVVDAVPRLVTDAMRDAVIALELEQLRSPGVETPAYPEESERVAREGPINDTLPAFQQIFPGVGGELWVVGFITPVDGTWSATRFDRAGAILGRLSGDATSVPVAFIETRVLVKETDENGVVRFVVRGVEG